MPEFKSYKPQNLFIIPLDSTDTNLSENLLGGKGYNLVKLVADGLNVPGGFIVTTEAFKYCMIATLASLKNCCISDAISEMSFPTRFKRELKKALKVFDKDFKNNIGVAVRSSAVGEDTSSASAAGVQRTLLNVIGEDAVFDAIKKCWESLFLRESYLYRGRRSDTSNPASMAVVVQRLVNSKKAGVLFTSKYLAYWFS